jgi:FkbM family methyltransferase
MVTHSTIGTTPRSRKSALRRFFKKDWKFLAEKYILKRHPEFEAEVRRSLKGFSGALSVDVGASMGVHTRLLAKRFKEVYAIEPNPKALAVLYSRIPSNVTVLETALTDHEGSATFYTDPHPVTTSSADTILPKFRYNPSPSRKGWPSGEPHTYEGQKGIAVKTTTYDNIINSRQADLVLIDVEGAEFLVLDGMKNSIASGRVKAILVELHDVDRRRELEGRLSNYELRWIDSDHLLAILKPRSVSNATTGIVA